MTEPQTADDWLKKGLELAKLGNHEEALECYDKAIELDLNYAPAWYNKGLALESLGRYGEARKAYEKAVALGLEEAREMLKLLDQAGL